MGRWPQLGSGAWLLRWTDDDAAFWRFVDHWGLVPDVAIAALALGHWSHELLGLRLWIVSGRRSALKQRWMRLRWRLGRREGLAAKPARDSAHTSGRAFDVAGDWALSTRQLADIGWIGEQLGLRWGGRFGDPKHFDARRGA